MRRRTFRRRGFRRRRRPGYIWLPNLGSNFIPADSDWDMAATAGNIVVENTGTPNTFIVPITFDTGRAFDSELGISSPTLSMLTGNDYLIRRIVGNFFAEVVPEYATDQAVPNALLVGAGLFVARAQTFDVGSDDLPIGVNGFPVDEKERWEDYSPLSREAHREPWLWKRTWVLGNRGVAVSDDKLAGTTFAGQNWSTFPANTALYPEGSGAKIDQKTLRKVTKDHRLFLSISALNMPDVERQPATFAYSLQLNWMYDLRILAKMRNHTKQEGSF